MLKRVKWNVFKPRVTCELFKFNHSHYYFTLHIQCDIPAGKFLSNGYREDTWRSGTAIHGLVVFPARVIFFTAKMSILVSPLSYSIVVIDLSKPNGPTELSKHASTVLRT